MISITIYQPPCKKKIKGVSTSHGVFYIAFTSENQYNSNCRAKIFMAQYCAGDARRWDAHRRVGSTDRPAALWQYTQQRAKAVEMIKTLKKNKKTKEKSKLSRDERENANGRSVNTISQVGHLLVGISRASAERRSSAGDVDGSLLLQQLTCFFPSFLLSLSVVIYISCAVVVFFFYAVRSPLYSITSKKKKLDKKKQRSRSFILWYWNWQIMYENKHRGNDDDDDDDIQLHRLSVEACDVSLVLIQRSGRNLSINLVFFFLLYSICARGLLKNKKKRWTKTLYFI